jgi:hypothetical protein
MIMKFKRPTIRIYYDIENDEYISDYRFNIQYRGTEEEYRFIELVKEI